jgi:hypothetical protein
MRGDDPQQAAMFSYLSPEERVPQEHPLRTMPADTHAGSRGVKRGRRGPGASQFLRPLSLLRQPGV